MCRSSSFQSGNLIQGLIHAKDTLPLRYTHWMCVCVWMDVFSPPFLVFKSLASTLGEVGPLFFAFGITLEKRAHSQSYCMGSHLFDPMSQLSL
jgi:hypothetical protein